ncbi:MAG: hypothetical protein AAF673_02190 [Pseudomonadota bacterium]
MLKKAITLTIVTSILSACVTGPEGYLKRSANNKLFDTKGFQGGKRAPLYNKKYISQAKKNILTNNLDEDIDEERDDLYEDSNPSQENIEMYKAMIDADIERKRKQKNKSSWWWNRKKKQSYPSITDANDRIDPRTHAQNLELREELNQIKAMLNDAKREMASHKCPTEQDQEKKASQVIKQDDLPRPTLNRKIPDDLEQKTKEIVTEKHVHSI